MKAKVSRILILFIEIVVLFCITEAVVTNFKGELLVSIQMIAWAIVNQLFILTYHLRRLKLAA